MWKMIGSIISLAESETVRFVYAASPLSTKHLVVSDLIWFFGV